MKEPEPVERPSLGELHNHFHHGKIKTCPLCYMRGWGEGHDEALAAAARNLREWAEDWNGRDALLKRPGAPSFQQSYMVIVACIDRIEAMAKEAAAYPERGDNQEGQRLGSDEKPQNTGTLAQGYPGAGWRAGSESPECSTGTGKPHAAASSSGLIDLSPIIEHSHDFKCCPHPDCVAERDERVRERDERVRKELAGAIGSGSLIATKVRRDALTDAARNLRQWAEENRRLSFLASPTVLSEVLMSISTIESCSERIEAMAKE